MKDINIYINERLVINKNSEDENEDDYIVAIGFLDKDGKRNVSTFNDRNDAVDFMAKFKEEKYFCGYLVPDTRELLWTVMDMIRTNDQKGLKQLIKENRIKSFVNETD